MIEEEIEEMKSRVDKLTCGMTKEETDALYNEILKLPKVERPITATTQCEINVNDLFDTIRAFRKIPDYNELIKDNHKKQQEIERLNNIISELEKWLEERKGDISFAYYHTLNKLQELKEGEKSEKN